jgi:hypothetical protein
LYNLWPISLDDSHSCLSHAQQVRFNHPIPPLGSSSFNLRSSYSLDFEPLSLLRPSISGVPRASLPSTSLPSSTLDTKLVPTMVGTNPNPNQAQMKT